MYGGGANFFALKLFWDRGYSHVDMMFSIEPLCCDFMYSHAMKLAIQNQLAEKLYACRGHLRSVLLGINLRWYVNLRNFVYNLVCFKANTGAPFVLLQQWNQILQELLSMENEVILINYEASRQEKDPKKDDASPESKPAVHAQVSEPSKPKTNSQNKDPKQDDASPESQPAVHSQVSEPSKPKTTSQKKDPKQDDASPESQPVVHAQVSEPSKLKTKCDGFDRLLVPILIPSAKTKGADGSLSNSGKQNFEGLINHNGAISGHANGSIFAMHNCKFSYKN